MWETMRNKRRACSHPAQKYKTILSYAGKRSTRACWCIECGKRLSEKVYPENKNAEGSGPSALEKK